MPRPSPVPDDEARELFARLQSIIRATLRTYYLLSVEEAEGAEEDLLVWFLRLSKRGGSQKLPESSLRLALLAASCQYGRSLQMWKLDGKRSSDPELNEVLSREPEEIALDLDRRLDEESR